MRNLSVRLLARLPIAFVLLVCSVPPANAVSEYYSLSRSVRALGMGGTFYGMSNDENAMFYNPAGLGFYEKGNDFMASLKGDTSLSFFSALSILTRPGTRSVGQVVADLESLQGNPITGNATPFFGYYLRKYFAMGLLLADTKGEFTVLGKDVDTSVDLTAISDSGIFFSGAFPLIDKLMFGFTLKGLLRAGGATSYSVLDIASGTGLATDLTTLGGVGAGLDLDIGFMWELPELIPGIRNRVSLVVNNLAASRFDLVRIRSSSSSTGVPPQLPRMLTLAGHTRLPGFWRFNHIDLLLDLAEFGVGGQASADLGARGGSFWKHVNFGVEVPFNGWAFGRMGFRQGNFTIGAGIDARYFQIDIATYAEELASLPGRMSSRRVALRLAAGFGGRMPTVPSATDTKVPEPSKPAAPETTGAATPNKPAL
jgi:hypothetical protein